MTILEALENAREFMEAQGVTSGDIYDDLVLAITRIRSKYREVAREIL